MSKGKKTSQAQVLYSLKLWIEPRIVNSVSKNQHQLIVWDEGGMWVLVVGYILLLTMLRASYVKIPLLSIEPGAVKAVRFFPLVLLGWGQVFPSSSKAAGSPLASLEKNCCVHILKSPLSGAPGLGPKLSLVQSSFESILLAITGFHMKAVQTVALGSVIMWQYRIPPEILSSNKKFCIPLLIQITYIQAYILLSCLCSSFYALNLAKIKSSPERFY